MAHRKMNYQAITVSIRFLKKSPIENIGHVVHKFCLTKLTFIEIINLIFLNDCHCTVSEAFKKPDFAIKSTSGMRILRRAVVYHSDNLKKE